MSEQEIQTALIEALQSVAPEVEPAALDPTLDLREQCDLDSMDFLNFVIALHQSLGVNIPEADYPNFVTMEKAAAYLADAKAGR